MTTTSVPFKLLSFKFSLLFICVLVYPLMLFKYVKFFIYIYVIILVMLSIYLNFFFFFCHTHSMWKFPGQGSNPCHSSDLNHISDNAESLTHWATRELPRKFVKRKEDIISMKRLASSLAWNTSPLGVHKQQKWHCSPGTLHTQSH